MISSQNINILTKALPHLPGKAKMYMDVLLKVNQLKSSLDNIEDLGIIQAQSHEDNSMKSIDIDALFKDIRPLCSGNDAHIIDMYSSLKKSRDIVNAYQSMNGGDLSGLYQ